jgi:hypothetical protein
VSTDGERKLMIAWLRYGDAFVKPDGTWLFAERNLYIDWTETRPSRTWQSFDDRAVDARA